MVGITAIGCLIGLSGAWALGSLAESMLFGMSGRDPVVIIASAAALIGTAVIASILPARRAAGVDPIRALRYE
jgi:ABC-type antimicrobial peptide transport system permease subunit